METLSEYTNRKQKFNDEMRKLQEPHPNGIKCPQCGNELWDTNPMIVLTSNPPQKNIHCPKCGYKGYALY